jgi:SPRY domain
LKSRLIIGWNKHSLAYTSLGQKRFNQPFNPSPQAILHPPFPLYHEGDVVGVGYRPRTGTIFFTRNGKKLEETIHPTFKSSNFFPTVGASGPCSIHINFGQAGFVFIEANVKKWGLAPMSGTLAPPPRYGREDESILLDSGRQHGGNQPKYSRGHNRGQSWVSVGGSAARTQTMQSDISLSSLPNNSPPGYESFSDGEDQVTEESQSDEGTPRASTDTAPLIERDEV